MITNIDSISDHSPPPDFILLSAPFAFYSRICSGIIPPQYLSAARCRVLPGAFDSISLFLCLQILGSFWELLSSPQTSRNKKKSFGEFCFLFFTRDSVSESPGPAGCVGLFKVTQIHFLFLEWSKTYLRTFCFVSASQWRHDVGMFAKAAQSVCRKIWNGIWINVQGSSERRWRCGVMQRFTSFDTTLIKTALC